MVFYRSNSIYLQLKGAVFTSVLFSGLICSFRKEILSSIICWRVTVTIYVKSGEAKLKMDGYDPAGTFRGGGYYLVTKIAISHSAD
jgi:hypothetical protein